MRVSKRVVALVSVFAFALAACSQTSSTDSTGKESGDGAPKTENAASTQDKYSWGCIPYSENVLPMSDAPEGVDPHAGGHASDGAATEDMEGMDHHAGDSQTSTTVDTSGMTEKEIAVALIGGLHGGETSSPCYELDEATQIELDAQLELATAVALKFSTLAEGKAGGYAMRAGPMSPLTATHYQGPGKDATEDFFDPSLPPTLLYDGIDPESKLVGLMYLGMGADGSPPEGFAGPNDHWHLHDGVCVKMAADGGMDSLTDPKMQGTNAEDCASRGGFYMGTTTYMLHVWVVPGQKPADGIFSAFDVNVDCPDGTYAITEMGACVNQHGPGYEENAET